jgi:hypothetical protein
VVCKALAAAIGYQISVQKDCASSWMYAEVRQRVFVSLIRDDLFDVWGRPPALVRPPSLTRQTIESTLLSPTHPLVIQELRDFTIELDVLEKAGSMGRWASPRQVKEGQPQCVWEIGCGKWGKRGFVRATPAHKRCLATSHEDPRALSGAPRRRRQQGGAANTGAGGGAEVPWAILQG